ncbi:MAG: tRNA (cytidine(34)-2'-O)-methyltransferase [Chromatiaceae bacterium]
MFHVILYQPEIPPNTGNIMRLCANLGARLHLIEPLGFVLEDRLLRRAGLDYREWVSVATHPDLDACLDSIGPLRLFGVSTRGCLSYADSVYQAGDAFLFGPETRGLPERLLESLPAERRLRIPMRPGNRSLNLSNAVAVVLFEAWRQQDFEGSAGPDPQPNSGLGSRSSRAAVASSGETPS